MDRLSVLARHVTAPVAASGSALQSSSTSAALTKPKEKKVAIYKTYEELVAMPLQEIRQRYGERRADGVEMSGVNHVAFVTKDMARTLWFWCEVLGMKLSKTLALPGNAQHFFIEGGNGMSIAYFYFPDAPPQALGVASVDMQKLLEGEGFATAHGSVNHMAFNVPANKLREYRAKVKSAKVGYVSPILFHSDVDPSGYSEKRDENTVWESFYFSGPDSEYLEFTAQTDRVFTPERDIQHKPAVEGER